MLVLIPRLVAVLVIPSVCASLSDPSPSAPQAREVLLWRQEGAALRVKTSLEFEFGCVRFVFSHDCLHCEAVLVVYKILPTSDLEPLRDSVIIRAETGVGEVLSNVLEPVKKPVRTVTL